MKDGNLKKCPLPEETVCNYQLDVEGLMRKLRVWSPFLFLSFSTPPFVLSLTNLSLKLLPYLALPGASPSP